MFAAIDFETANQDRDSACAVAVVRVESGAVVAKRSWLIRPPTRKFRFTHIHGISWSDVQGAPDFATVWRQAAELTAGVAFFAAHSAKFDRSVLDACCRSASLPVPTAPFRCTVALARSAFGLFPTTLPDVCRFLGIALRHHDPLSDAEACARIVVAAEALARGRTP